MIIIKTIPAKEQETILPVLFSICRELFSKFTNDYVIEFHIFTSLIYPQWKYFSTNFNISSGLSCISVRKVLSL